jgi:hypothetical protein
MIDKEAAKKLVEEYFNTYKRGAMLQDDEYVVIDIATIEKGYGWIFICNSRKYMETKDRQYFLLGVSPVVVEKEDGSLHFLPTPPPLEERIREYEAQRRQKGNRKN